MPILKAPPILLSLLLTASTLQAQERWAPHAVAGPVNQLVVSGNACGPSALLASIRCGGPRWVEIAQQLPGSSDRAKLLYIIKAHGLRPSISLRDRNRWTRHGINAEDLHAIAGELAAIGGLPAPKSEALLLGPRESAHAGLRRLHKYCRRSLIQGFPPVLSLRRYVLRKGHWTSLESHFVTVVEVPDRLPRKDTQFSLTYFDPWGGKKRTAILQEPALPLLSSDDQKPGALDLQAPHADIGRDQIRKGEPTAIVPAMLIGTW
ncbi:hypothetical protein HNR46_000944 [Haloferula luteola]|uniref:Peptidase C39-like domain-containing protein n=1 Tax=Haloferula luteola TaxID=595692 RepID=A0A840V0X1_9BACT|nr:hypothetical protein [Haloferula luteola]MBB5350716.1 hypothetical protein [Haloferula luteola]